MKSKEKKYKALLVLYHGTTVENAESIMKNGYSELFLTNNKRRAMSYGECVLIFWKQFYFDSMKEKESFYLRWNMAKISTEFIDYLAKDNELRPLLFRKMYDQSTLKDEAKKVYNM